MAEAIHTMLRNDVPFMNTNVKGRVRGKITCPLCDTHIPTAARTLLMCYFERSDELHQAFVLQYLEFVQVINEHISAFTDK